MNFKRELRDLKIELVKRYKKSNYFLFEHVSLINNKCNAIRVAYHLENQRLDDYLTNYLYCGKEEIVSYINSGKIKVNFRKKKCDYRVIRDDLITISKSIKMKEHRVDDIDFEILKETNQYIIINKPSGIKVHSNFPDNENSVLECLKKARKIERPKYIYYESNMVHRLDKYTSGPIIIAKKQKYIGKLKRLFKSRDVKKCYFAIVHGYFSNRNGIVDFPVLRGYDKLYGNYMIISNKHYKWARTIYNVIGEHNGFSFVRLEIVTGRTHQIRLHMSVLGHPVCGDRFYSIYEDKAFPRQMLHSFLLEFRDPFSKEETRVVLPLPQDMREILKEVYYESV